MPRNKVVSGQENPIVDLELRVRSSEVKLPLLLKEIRRLTENLTVDEVELQLVEQTIVQNSTLGKTLFTVTSKFQSKG